MNLKFKDWFYNEVGTSAAGVGGGGTYTGDVAKFAMPIGGMVTRKSTSLLTVDDLENKKRNPKKKVKF